MLEIAMVQKIHSDGDDLAALGRNLLKSSCVARQEERRRGLASPSGPLPLADFLSPLPLRWHHSSSPFVRMCLASSFCPAYSGRLTPFSPSMSLKEDNKEVVT